ncbi:MAG TPA: Na+/H+ antiporter NhaA [Gammaproteobacteria bacterium]
MVDRHAAPEPLPPAQLLAEKLLAGLERFLHIEAVSGILLLAAAATAFVWANSPFADAYHGFSHVPLSLGIGGFLFAQPLHFYVNDVLMTVFFLVAGLEIRRELHDGALSNLRLAALPLAAAAGGVAVPAAIYLAINPDAVLREGWAVPTATDIAFAVGVLALLGRSIPSSVRIFLLAIAIIDDIAAVIIIATFYSGGLDPSGLLIAGSGVLLVLGFQRIGVGAAFAYLVPGAILWFGLFRAGVHPTLAGVVLGLLTPVIPMKRRERPLDLAMKALERFKRNAQSRGHDRGADLAPLKDLRAAQRELLPPVVRVEAALHPWVAYGVMPLFALANAGVSLSGLELTSGSAQSVLIGVAAALVVGKPVGITLGSWLAVRLGWCHLPRGVTWRSVALVGCLGGIGFTMSIFIATLAFGSESLLAAAKSGVLIASVMAGVIGLILGRIEVGRARASQRSRDASARV